MEKPIKFTVYNARTGGTDSFMIGKGFMGCLNQEQAKIQLLYGKKIRLSDGTMARQFYELHEPEAKAKLQPATLKSGMPIPQQESHATVIDKLKGLSHEQLDRLLALANGDKPVSESKPKGKE